MHVCFKWGLHLFSHESMKEKMKEMPNGCYVGGPYNETLIFDEKLHF